LEHFTLSQFGAQSKGCASNELVWMIQVIPKRIAEEMEKKKKKKKKKKL
jgi:hypothetical protein